MFICFSLFVCFLNKDPEAHRHFHESRLAAWNLSLWKNRWTTPEEKISSPGSGVQHSWKSSCWGAARSPPAQLLVLCTPSCQVCCSYQASSEFHAFHYSVFYCNDCAVCQYPLLLFAFILTLNVLHCNNFPIYWIFYSLKAMLIHALPNSSLWINVCQRENSYR